MPRKDQPTVRKSAIFVTERRNGKTVYIRRPYNIVEYNWGDGTGTTDDNYKTFLQPTGGRGRGANETEEVYDEIRLFDVPPTYDTVYGGGK